MMGLLGMVTLLSFMFPLEMIILRNGLSNKEAQDQEVTDKTKTLECFDEISNEMLRETNTFKVASNEPKTCLIFLPKNVVVDFKQLNFESEETYVRVLAGHRKGTVTYSFSPLFTQNVTDDYGFFSVKCPFGVIAFRPHGFPNKESFEFSLSPIEKPIIWSSTCPQMKKMS